MKTSTRRQRNPRPVKPLRQPEQEEVPVSRHCNRSASAKAAALSRRSLVLHDPQGKAHGSGFGGLLMFQDHLLAG